LFFRSRISDGSRRLKKICSLSTRKRGIIIAHYCAVPHSQPPFIYCLQYCAIYFPHDHDPLYCNKILAISCKGQPIAPLPACLRRADDAMRAMQPRRIFFFFFFGLCIPVYSHSVHTVFTTVHSSGEVLEQFQARFQAYVLTTLGSRLTRRGGGR